MMMIIIKVVQKIREIGDGPGVITYISGYFQQCCNTIFWLIHPLKIKFVAKNSPKIHFIFQIILVETRQNESIAQSWD